MKLMQIGSSLINMENFTNVDARTVEDGVVVTIEHEHSIKEYLVPDEIDPELVIKVMMESVYSCARFDLPFMLRLRRRNIDDED